MTHAGCCHPRSAIQRMTLPRRMGWRGIVKLAKHCAKQIIAMRKYFPGKANTPQLHKVVVQADDNYTHLNLKQQSNSHLSNKNGLLETESPPRCISYCIANPNLHTFLHVRSVHFCTLHTTRTVMSFASSHLPHRHQFF